MRTEPSVSVPSAATQSFAATATAEPLLEPPGVKPARRIVVTDREPNKSCLVSDAPTPDVRIDPARLETITGKRGVAIAVSAIGHGQR